MLPVPTDQAVTLGEGGTPLHLARRMGELLGLKRLYIKDESCNPTHSYKDRLSAVAVSHARAQGASVVATASSGNAGASLAAYAARAGLQCVVASMKGASGPMMAQIRKYGAHLVMMDDKSLRWPLLAEGAARHGWYVTSPHAAPVVGSTAVGIEGYKTIAYEIVGDLGSAPDWVVMPVCYGDALAGIAQGFEDLLCAGEIDKRPRLVAAEAHGSLVNAMAHQTDCVDAVDAEYATLAASVGANQSTYQALHWLRMSDGLAVQIGNEGLIDMQELVACREGLLYELASVMPFVAARQLARSGVMREDDTVVCLATASGLKDTDKSTGSWNPLPVVTVGREQIPELASATHNLLSQRGGSVR
ncbi:pyridoxal-phosphate dependent enzyme [Hydrogenophaga sp. BPS33]|nr:pyridoxal-phosphate dependent enzyme [Hydrogenophaga sp. BPS33]